MQPRFKKTTGLEKKWSRVAIKEEGEIMNTDNRLLNKFWLALSFILGGALSVTKSFKISTYDCIEFRVPVRKHCRVILCARRLWSFKSVWIVSHLFTSISTELMKSSKVPQKRSPSKSQGCPLLENVQKWAHRVNFPAWVQLLWDGRYQRCTETLYLSNEDTEVQIR